MERNVCCSCFLFLFVISTHGRVAVNDVSNQIDGHEAETTRPKSILDDIISANFTDVAILSKAILEISRNYTTRPCSHHIDVTDNEIHPNGNEPCEHTSKVDNGTALILTPYLEEGRVLEARKASVVDPDLFLGVKSYSGYFTVNKTYDSNIFFWYFPVEKKPVNETPWILWLQGGPGASSLVGLFDEIGPFKANFRGTLDRNPYTWLQNHSLVFIDNPVGTGYSFTNHKDGYARDMATYSNHLYSTLKQFLQVFPELRTAPLFLAGESYAGKYVPALGMEIHTHKHEDGDINLKGMIIGNAFVEPGMLWSVPKTFYNFGLLSHDQMEVVKPLNNAFRQAIADNRSVDAKEKWGELVWTLLLLSHQEQAYNFLRDGMKWGKYELFLSKSEVKRALHVGDIAHEMVNITVNIELAPDFLTSTRPQFEELLNHYPVLAYCGQLDQMLACPVTAEHYRKWKWEQSDQFLNANRKPYLYKNRLAGYHKSGGHLTEVVVRGAGHMAAQDAPGAVLRLVSRWTHGLPLDTSLRYNLTNIKEFVRNLTSHANLYLRDARGVRLCPAGRTACRSTPPCGTTSPTSRNSCGTTPRTLTCI